MRHKAELAWRLPPRLSRFLTTVPDEASIGDTPQKWAKAPLVSQALGVVAGRHEERSGRLEADAVTGDQLGGSGRHEWLQDRLQLGELGLELEDAHGEEPKGVLRGTVRGGGIAGAQLRRRAHQFEHVGPAKLFAQVLGTGEATGLASD